MRTTTRVSGLHPVGLAVAAGCGAWVATVPSGTVPHARWWVVGAGIVVIAAVVALVRVGGVAWPYLGVAVLALILGQRSMAGLRSEPVPAQVQAEVTLLTDPAPGAGGSMRAEVRLGGRRLAAVAHRTAAATLEGRLAGERVVVRGRLLPPGRFERIQRHRHLTGRLHVETVMGWRHGHAVTRAVNGLRRTLDRGATSLSPRQRSLLAGVTLGDDREQPADLTETFRAAGLGHLSAASGQNVAFVMVMAAPVLTRVRFATRLVLTLSVLAGFALLTRGEPSVLRATGMAAVGAFAAATGRPTSSLHTLGWAVTGLLLVDPLLVTSLGFQLSVAGAGGIVVGSGPIQRRLPGPRWLTLPLAVTVAAQAAVAPLLVAAFGPLSLAAVPANVLAVPAAGPVMIWGLTGGLAAGVVGEPWAAVLHLPTKVLLTWIETVASLAARWPLGVLTGWHLVALGVALAAAVTAHLAMVTTPRLARAVRSGAVVVGLGALVVALAVPPADTGADSGPLVVGPGMTLWRGMTGGTGLVVDGRVAEAELWSGLYRAGVRRVDWVVVRTTSERAVAAGRAVRSRWPAATVMVPSAAEDRGPGVVVVDAGTAVVVGEARIVAGRDRLVVEGLADPEHDDTSAHARAPPLGPGRTAETAARLILGRDRLHRWVHG